MERIRVLLAGMSPGLADGFAEAIAHRPDMEVVDNTDVGVELLMAAGRTQADAVIIALDDSELPGICTHLLDERPDLIILGVTADGRHASLLDLQPLAVSLGEMSREEMLAALRAAIRSGRTG